MKRTIKFGIIALLAVFALSMTSCNLDEGNDDVPKFIEITNCSITNGRVTVGIVDMDPKGEKPFDASKDIKAYNEGDAAATIKLALLSDKTKEQYTGTGNYYIILIFKNVSVTTTYWYVGPGGASLPLKYNLKDETSSIDFSLFKEID